ncbi:MAG: hypothetical protein ABR587_11640 [Candidatus Binatia bacterium]
MQHTDFTRPIVAALVSATLLVTPVAVHAQSCDPDTEARLEFIETRLEEGKSREQLWWRSWFAVFTIGVAWGMVSAELENDKGIAANNYVTAGKSVLGIADLSLRPHVGRHGASKIRAIPKTSAASCAERLRYAEKTMEQAADAANVRWSWKRHMSSLVVNLGSAIALSAATEEHGQAWQDFGISTVSAEVHIWTHPTRAVDDWTAYREQFAGKPAAGAPSTLRFAATPGGGVGVIWKF